MLSPKEIAYECIKIGTKKGKMNTLNKILLGILAGMFIGFGAQGSMTVMQTMGSIDVGLMKFFGAFVFPVGLMLVIIAGGELFTGNSLMTLAFMDKKISLRELLSNWILVYFGNFLGSIFLALLVFKSGLAQGDVGALAMSIAKGKLELDFSAAIIRGFLCNILVVLAVWMSFGAKDIISKIFSIWFPIMLFVLLGFEHSVANMYYLPLGKFLGANISWGDIWVKNLLPVTLGNILGGAVFISFIYYIVYILPDYKKQNVQLYKNK